MLTLLSLIPESEQADTVCRLMQALAVQSALTVPLEFITHSPVAMKRLKDAGRSNILALLAKALGKMQPDGAESLMPVDRMPLGLMEYAVNLFTSTRVMKLPIAYIHYQAQYIIALSRFLSVLMTTNAGMR